jgi:hypothetical protein
MFTPQSHTPKLFFTFLLSKIACQAPKPTKNPVTQASSTDKTLAKVIFSYGQSGKIEIEEKNKQARLTSRA